ncbi:MAG: exodeoxyribonuclease VII large subunit [Candidatus Dormibacteria bacterium]
MSAAFSVSQLTAMVSDTLSRRPELEDVLVEGEISSVTRSSAGHLYITLKDAEATLRVVCFRTHAQRVPFAPRSGMTVLVHGFVNVYAQGGQYQLQADRLEPSGVGALALAVEQRKQALAARGLFAEARKRPLPRLPRRVAVVTSRHAAALRDVVTTLHRRAPMVDVVLSPATVQGDGAAATIVIALERAARVRGAEVVLLVRGGGSLEDLMAFNEESVAHAVAACPLPVVTGIGHATDLTIADLVADRHAPTPSVAAEMVAPDTRELAVELRGRAGRLHAALSAGTRRRRERLIAGRRRLDQLSPLLTVRRLRADLGHHDERLRLSLLAAVTRRQRDLEQRRSALATRSPAALLPLRRAQLAGRERQLASALGALREGWRHRLARSERLAPAAAALLGGHRQALHARTGRLHALSPLQVLQRGYSVTREESSGRVLTSARAVQAGSRLRTLLADGAVLSEVLGVDADAERMYDERPPTTPSEDDHGR